MKYHVSLLALLVLVCGVAVAEDTYTDKYDNIDLDEILNNDRLYKKYFDCLTGDGKCTPDGKQLKEIIPDALNTKCAKCNEKQKAGAEKALKFIITKKPKDWERLQKIFDPEGKYTEKYKEFAKEHGIPLN